MNRNTVNVLLFYVYMFVQRINELEHHEGKLNARVTGSMAATNTIAAGITDAWCVPSWAPALLGALMSRAPGL